MIQVEPPEVLESGVGDGGVIEMEGVQIAQF
jgi:hypothetical protein